VVIGITAAVIAAWFVGNIESAEALAFLGPIAGGATAWLWVKQASKDAAETALSQPAGTNRIE
jgi:positive regulator of sigma E activity